MMIMLITYTVKTNKQTKQNKKSLAPFFLYSENLTKLKLFCLFVAICESSCFPFFFKIQVHSNIVNKTNRCVFVAHFAMFVCFH